MKNDLFSPDWYYGECHGVMGFIPANHIKILPYGDDGNEKVYSCYLSVRYRIRDS